MYFNRSGRHWLAGARRQLAGGGTGRRRGHISGPHGGRCMPPAVLQSFVRCRRQFASRAGAQAAALEAGLGGGGDCSGQQWPAVTAQRRPTQWQPHAAGCAEALCAVGVSLQGWCAALEAGFSSSSWRHWGGDGTTAACTVAAACRRLCCVLCALSASVCRAGAQQWRPASAAAAATAVGSNGQR